jgi:hypothetical protein
MTGKKIVNETKPSTVVANDPADRKGRLQRIGGSQSDHWNNTLANQTLQALWVKNSSQEERDKQFPMQSKLPMHLSPRCGARTRSGNPCQSPAMPNGRCRLHGGLSPGAPKGNRNASNSQSGTTPRASVGCGTKRTHRTNPAAPHVREDLVICRRISVNPRVGKLCILSLAARV